MASDINQINSGQNATNSIAKKAGGTHKTGDNPANPAAEPTGTETSAADTLTVTDQAVKLQQFEQALADIPDVDAERVEQLRRDLASGDYSIDPAVIAEKLLAFEQELV